MSKRAKPTAQVVYLLEEVLPYEGSETIGIFATPELAMLDREVDGPQHSSKRVVPRWTEVRRDGEHFWTTRPGESMNPYFLITEWNVRA